MQVVKSIKINLELNDIAENIQQMNKVQIIEKFKLLLEIKQIQINDKIEKLNAEHLLILQKKVLVLQKKNEQIFNLNNTVSAYKNSLNQEKKKSEELIEQMIQIKAKMLSFEKKNEGFDSILKAELEKREKLKIKFQQLIKQAQKTKQLFIEQERAHKKIKQEKTIWNQEMNLLLMNQKQVLQKKFAHQIKHIRLDSDYKQSSFKKKIEDITIAKNKEEKRKLEYKKMSSDLAKKIQGLEKDIMSLKQKLKQKFPNKIQVETQTNQQNAQKTGQLNERQIEEQNDSKDAEIQVIFQCQNCESYLQKIKILQSRRQNQSNLYKKGNLKINPMVERGVQVKELQKNKKQQQAQTLYNYLQLDEQQKLINNMQRVIEIHKKSYGLLLDKYSQLQDYYLRRPSRAQDIKKIENLQKKVIQLELFLLQKENQIESFKIVSDQLDRQINTRDQVLNTIPVAIQGHSAYNEKDRKNQYFGQSVKLSSNRVKHRNMAKTICDTLPCDIQSGYSPFGYEKYNQDSFLQVLNSSLFEKGLRIRSIQNKQRKSVSQTSGRKNLYRKYKSPTKLVNRSDRKL